MNQAGANAKANAKATAQQAHNSDWIDTAARAGLVAYGVVHVLIGYLAVQLALGDREGAASTDGALQQLAEQPFGQALVWAVAVGFFLLVLWQGLEAAVGRRDEEGGKRTLKRLVSAGRAIVYLVIGISAVTKATGSGSSGGGGGGTDSTTAKVMEWPGGQVLVFLGGLAVIGVGVALLVMAYRESYLKHLDGQGRSGDTGTAYRWLARVGHVAKGISLGIVGGLFCYAAVTHDPKKSGGLDQALREVLDQTLGPVLLVLMGLGLAAYGVYCFAWARHFRK